MSQDTNRLAGWLGATMGTPERYAAPPQTEQTATADGAVQFVGTALRMADHADRTEPDPARRARRIAAIAAVADDFVRAAANRTGSGADSHDEWDDPPPEMLRARDRMEYCRGVVTGLAARAEARLASAGLDREPPEREPSEWSAEEPEETPWHQVASAAQHAAHACHAATLIWHLERIAALPEASIDEIGGHILAMWPHETYVTGTGTNTGGSGRRRGVREPARPSA